MIKIVKFDDEILIKEIESIFYEVYTQKNELKNEFLNNPYTKIYAYVENSNIIGIIHINDIYDRYEINNIFVLREHRNKKVASQLMEKIIKEMKKKHEAIRNVYLSGIPKFQADVKTAPYKAELVILKQNANKLRQKNRKNFESILTTEQKAEFQILKQEFSKKHHNKETKEIN